MRIPLAVAAGGAIGASARYLLVGGLDHWLGAGFPMGTLAVNALGSFMLGILIEVTALVWSPAPELRALLVVGVLGSFTTVSAFSLDALVLFERGASGLAGLYLAASVTLSLAGIYAGMRLLRLALS
ncbi:MAG: fluoride efflux transporter CrcB [Proteobacteria bacterium]|nr:fluoride efflux transporter CrcB [Pseudomonadota bacterium]